MKRLSFIAAVLLCFVTVVSAAIRPAQPGIGGGGSTVSGSITGAYSFNGPFSTVNATNVYLNAGISNLAVNLPVTNLNANQFSGTTIYSLKSGGLQTNGFFYASASGLHPLSIFGAAGQSVDLFRINDSAGARKFGIDRNGVPYGDGGGNLRLLSTFLDGDFYVGTNLFVTNGVTLPSLTASRPLILNASGNVTNATGTPDGTKFLRDDGTLAVPSAGTVVGADGDVLLNQGDVAIGTNALNFNIAIPALKIYGASARDSLWLIENGGGNGSNVMSYRSIQMMTNGATTININADAGGSVTAGSFIGSGTGVPIIKLQTMMSADNAFAITVATNRIASTTNTFDFTNAAVNDVIKVHSSSAGQVVWTNGAAAGGSQTPWAQNIDGGGYSLTNVQHVNVGTNINAPSQNSTLNISGTNSAGSMIGWEITSSNALFRLRSSTAPTAAIPLTVSTSGVVTATMFQTIGGASMSVGVLSTVGNSAGRVDVGAGASLKGRVNGTLDILDVSANATLHGVFLGGANQTNSQLQVLSSSTVNSNSTINVRSGNTNNWINFGAGSFDVVAVNNPTFTAPFSMNALQGAQLWSDGTNLCVVLQNSGGTRTTNKLSMTAWP